VYVQQLRIELGILLAESKKFFEMECSIGIVTREECRKTTYGAVNKELTLLSELSEDKQTVLNLRLDECEYHEIKYFVKYNHLFGNTCCDLLKVHKRTINPSLLCWGFTYPSRCISPTAKIRCIFVICSLQ
jgi:hypothetical protein